jgi:hypothetical protein
MPLIGAFTTDWQESPVPDEEKSRKTGRPEVVEGQKAMSFGGTFYYRGALPLTTLGIKSPDWDVKLSWRFQTAPDGHIRMMDPTGEWFDPDVIWTQRWMHKEGHDQMVAARATGQIVISDLDDGFWNLPKSNIAHSTTDAKNNPDFNRDHYLRCLSASNLITVSTDALASDMERLCPGVPVAICKNAIDLNWWKRHDPGVDSFIGWVGGIQWRANDLGVLRSFLPKFLEEHGLPIYHGGDSEVPGVPKFWEQMGIDPQKTPCATAPLCHIAHYPELWTPVGLALIPLENHPFNVRKSHLKGLEASACGVPFIYSSKMPEYEQFGAGIEADNSKPKTWVAALERMLDADERRKAGAEGFAVAQNWDIAKRWTVWDEAFRTVVPMPVS